MYEIVLYYKHEGEDLEEIHGFPLWGEAMDFMLYVASRLPSLIAEGRDNIPTHWELRQCL